MDDLIRQIVNQLRGIWRRRWIGLGIAWLIALVGSVVVFRIPETYEASSRVYVDTQSILRPLMSGLTVQPDTDQQVAILSRTLISRPNVEKLIRMAELDYSVKSAPEREALIDRLMRTLQIKRAERENFYTISYRDQSGTEAQRVVQGLVSIFVESSLGDKRRGADTARRFIEEQIKGYERKLEEAENRLKDFKLKHMNLMGPAGKDYFAQIGALSEELTRGQMELRAAEQSRDALKRELAGEEPVFLPSETPATGTFASLVPELDARIDAQRKALDELLRRFTDQHPDVLGTRRVIEQLEEQRREELQARRKAAAAAAANAKPQPISPSTNPVFQQLKVAYAEAEANVAALRARVVDLDSRYRQLQASARSLPQVEAELAQLNRDYEVQKRNYESLVSRRESAALSNDLDTTAGVADFRIVDPPSVPAKPVAPNRTLLLSLVLIVALGAGAFVSFLVSQILPTFHDARALRELTQRPVLGTVTLLWTPLALRHRRRSAWLFAGGVVGLVGLFASAIVVLTMKPGLV
jgi:polysaccharide chain length determinant protein (PEP-CTERM system associated)